jgi:hypothetical protein
MDFMASLEVKKVSPAINYQDRIMLVGSCFTEHIGNALAESKFRVLQNPNGILFDSYSVAKSLVSYVRDRRYSRQDFFYLNELWHSWDHHSRYSNLDVDEAVRQVNRSQEQAHRFLRTATWLIVTLGSSFSYRLTELSGQVQDGRTGVANCHRAPAQWFNKHLLETDETIAALENCYRELKQFNPELRLIFTVSPVRHLRDGLVENNRSKARLIEAVHSMTDRYPDIYYFPAYELVIDVLRDYRFYDVDLAHPNYLATEFVLEKFSSACIDEASRELMKEIKKISIARKHKAFQPATQAHRQFLLAQLEKVQSLKKANPFLDFAEELAYFSQT